MPPAPGVRAEALGMTWRFVVSTTPNHVIPTGAAGGGRNLLRAQRRARNAKHTTSNHVILIRHDHQADPRCGRAYGMDGLSGSLCSWLCCTGQETPRQTVSRCVLLRLVNDWCWIGAVSKVVSNGLMQCVMMGTENKKGSIMDKTWWAPRDSNPEPAD